MDQPMQAVPRTSQNAVQVISNTWARDSHDLFDFEASHLHTVTFTVPKSMKCIRSGTEVQMINDHMTPPAGADPLLRLVQKDGTFWVDKATPSSSSKKLWLVVRDLATNGHRLQEGDVIKLGRFKFRVRQMVSQAAGGVQPELRLGLDEGMVTCNDKDQALLHSTMCRICLLEGPGEGDPLIRPCSCRGSIEYVHLGCLRHWIRGRLNFSDTPSGSFFYRPLACELCKEVYPAYVEVEGSEKESLVEVPKTTPPFIVLENMVRDSQQHAARGLHVISLADKVLKLGRGHESHVRIADVSISRCHAIIRYQNGAFLLEDNKSKFGTLVAMKKPRALEVGANTSIQMGRTVLSLSLQPLQGDASPSAAPGSAALLQQQLPPSTPQDERALRLAMMQRGNSWEEEAGEQRHAMNQDEPESL
eukprot:CAMPEP_0178421864 /NCGR_PEP_ID=MMETSP0689_2-20121128/26871_1 /TAXON_ID=160604 /ORGANISM="Amphidinium massartii, Strain CS-259" /LENGTH=417 /DNA_ID=CAMNT_0020043397 /DNA_START=47 /DNA_END=1300 /DNA_ORIENTATION=-